MHHPTDRIIHTTVFVTPVVEHCLELEIAHWVDHEGSIHERTLLPRMYISLPFISVDKHVLQLFFSYSLFLLKIYYYERFMQ